MKNQKGWRFSVATHDKYQQTDKRVAAIQSAKKGG